MDNHEVRSYQDHSIRMVYRDHKDGNNQMLISVVDVISAITSSQDPRKYWNVIKHRIIKNEPHIIEKIEKIKLQGKNGQIRETDTTTIDGIEYVMERMPAGREHGDKFLDWLRKQEGEDNDFIPVMRAANVYDTLENYYDNQHDWDEMSLMRAELQYYKGNFEEAALIAKLHMNDANSYARGSASNICALSSVALNRIEDANRGINGMLEVMREAKEKNDHELQSLMTLMLDAIFVGLNDPNKILLEDLLLQFENIPNTLKPWAWHIYCRRLCIEEEYDKILGAVDVARTLLRKERPIQQAYMETMKAVALINLKQIDKGRECVRKAFLLCQPGGICAPIGDIQLIMPGLIDERLTMEYPEECEKINRFTEALRSGVNLIRKARGDDNVPEGLTRTEAVLASLASRGWNNREIVDYMGLSENTVKRYLSVIYDKLHIDGRKELKKFFI